MTEFDAIMDRVQEHAVQVYPKDLFDQYRLLEKKFWERDETAKLQIAYKIKEIKESINQKRLSLDWKSFFNNLLGKVENKDRISLKDIITMEYAPVEMSEHIIKISKIIAKRRTEENSEEVRVCKSIYGFTTCIKPCAYGAYGSCLFAARKNDDKSLAEKIFGNITTVGGFLKEMEALTFSNNRKLITTSHKVNNEVLEVILNTIRAARNNSSLASLPICVSLGHLNEAQIVQLKDAGATRINHNLETSYYNSLYLAAISNNQNNNGDKTNSSNEYRKRLTTLITALKNKIGVCSGGMFFYGDDEIVEDRILLYLTLNELDKIFEINSSPFNVYVPLRDIVDESIGWFNAFELPSVERKETISRFTILKTLLSFSLIASTHHKIIISAGSKWLGDEYYKLAVELGGGAGLANYLQQMDNEKTIATVQALMNSNATENTLRYYPYNVTYKSL